MTTDMTSYTIIKRKDGKRVPYDARKIVMAISKSAARVGYLFSDDEIFDIIDFVEKRMRRSRMEAIPVANMHNYVEAALDVINPKVAKSYRDFRNWKEEWAKDFGDLFDKANKIMFVGDKENSNADSALVSTKRALIYGELNKMLYRRTFLTDKETEMLNRGYLWAHDMNARRDSMNCCLCDISSILNGGFEMGNIWYNEPKSLDTAFDVIGDVVLSAASQQYGGFSLPQIDEVLEKYAICSYDKARIAYIKNIEDYENDPIKKELLRTLIHTLPNAEPGDAPDLDEFADVDKNYITEILGKAHTNALNIVTREMEQGFQGWEYKFNTVASSRGDYPFITISFGLSTSIFGKIVSMAALSVREHGQGKPGFKKPVLFPKLVFLYDENLHGPGKELEDLFEAGIRCSAATMYPDWLSLTGEGYIASMYKKYGKVVSPMGCRAFLSPYYEEGKQDGPANENDKPVFIGRFNIGAISLNLPLIYLEAKHNGVDFYQFLDEVLEVIRGLHQRTYNYLGELPASTNPLMCCWGGFYGGHLGFHDKMAPLLDSATASFGITALNELQEAYNGKSLKEDGDFALEVLKHINDKVEEFKVADHHLYAIYGTPAESLCFSGDTIVQTYQQNKQIKDLKVGDLVYTFNETLKKIELKPIIRSMMTKKMAEVVKITFDNGQTITCTPDHLFATRITIQDEKGKFLTETVKYVKAKDLFYGDRIKSNYIKVNSDGHLKCTTDQYIHDINAEYFLGEKPLNYVTHHKNGDKLNNDITNLEYILDHDHRVYHVKDNIDKYKFTSEQVSGEKNLFYGKSHTKVSKEKNKIAHLGKNNVNSKEIVQLDLQGKIIQIFESRGIAEKTTGFKNISYACNGKYKSKLQNHEYNGFLWYFKKDIRHYAAENHRVDSVQYLKDMIPVYDIEVADNHNFYVGGNDGILVHNCGRQAEQLRTAYGIINGVSDKPYVSNSFHCHVTEQISPTEKQDCEGRFWEYCNGGKIQYCRYPVAYNTDAVRTLIRRAMDKGFYEGVNMSLSYCDDCGHQELEMDVCPVCGSKNLTKIDRMNGYLSYSRVHGETRLNDAKMAEIADRVSM